MTSTAMAELRRYLLTFFATELGKRPEDDPESCETKGVREFTLSWPSRGTHVQGVLASIRDREDIIEFGLLERHGEDTTNLLNATVVLDEALLVCSSAINDEFNFSARLSPGKPDRLQSVLDFFAEQLRSSADR